MRRGRANDEVEPGTGGDLVDHEPSEPRASASVEALVTSATGACAAFRGLESIAAALTSDPAWL